jgi:DNA-binding transcriptional LysR family regulator
MNIDWNNLQFCLAVAREGTISAAAKRLGVDHATIIRRIDRLEDELGVKCFARRKTGYELTDAGRRAAAMAETIETEIRAGQAEISGGLARLTGSVRIGAPDGFGSFFLAPRLGDLAGLHPELQLELVATARLFSLSKREADIAIGLTLPRDGQIIGRKLVDYRLFLYASRDYLAENGPIENPEELRNRRIISYINELLFTPELDYLPQILPGLSAQIRSANLIAQLQAALAGVGIAILPRFLAQAYPSLCPILPEQLGIFRSFYLLMHADGRKFPQVRAVADYLYALVEREKALFLDPP